jgi:hypothetical protein
LAGTQGAAEALLAFGCDVGAWGDAEYAFEGALEMGGAAVCGAGDRREWQCVIEVRVHVRARALHEGDAAIGYRCHVGVAAFAGAVSGALGDVWSGEHLDVLAPRLAGRA